MLSLLIIFNNSSRNPFLIWDCKQIYASQGASGNDDVGIVVLSNDVLYITYSEESGYANFEFFNSSDSGLTWNGPYTGMQNGSLNFGSASCVPDSNDIIHCVVKESVNDYTYYVFDLYFSMN